MAQVRGEKKYLNAKECKAFCIRQILTKLCQAQISTLSKRVKSPRDILETVIDSIILMVDLVNERHCALIHGYVFRRRFSSIIVNVSGLPL